MTVIVKKTRGLLKKINWSVNAKNVSPVLCLQPYG